MLCLIGENTNNLHNYKWMRPNDLIFSWTFSFRLMLACWPCWRAGRWSCTTGCHWRTWCRHSSARLQHSQNAPWPRRVQRSKSSVKEAEEECLSAQSSAQHLSIWVQRGREVTFGLSTRSALLVLSRQMPSSTASSVEKSLLIWSLWQLPSFSAPLSVQLSVWGDFCRQNV